MEAQINFGGVYLGRSDFDGSLRDWIAFSIAFAANTGCRDKEAALELLRHDADRIIECVKAGRVVPVEESEVCAFDE